MTDRYRSPSRDYTQQNQVQNSLAQQAQAGSDKAKVELIESMKPIYWSMIRHYKYITADHYDDAESECKYAILIALDRYKPQYVINFSSFASQYLKMFLYKYTREMLTPVRIPRRVMSDYIKWKNEYREDLKLGNIKITNVDMWFSTVSTDILTSVFRTLGKDDPELTNIIERESDAELKKN